MCDHLCQNLELSITNSSPSKAMSALQSITSLVTSLFPNVLDLPQINNLISNLIQMPTTGDHNNTTAEYDSNGITSGQSLADPLEDRRERHRKTERIRHNKIIELIRQLSESIGINNKHETQSNVLNRSARYVLFLSYVIDKLEVDCSEGADILSDEWLQSLYPLYQRAYDEASILLQNAHEGINCFDQSEAKLHTNLYSGSLPTINKVGNCK